MTALPVAKSMVHRAAAAYTGWGLSVIPIADLRTKAPGLDVWKPYQERLPTPSEIDTWFGPFPGIGIVCGKVSGNLTVIDFDVLPDKTCQFDEWLELVSEALPELVPNLVVMASQSGGRHVYVRCAGQCDGPTKLARSVPITAPHKHTGVEETRKRTIIETKAEGGQVVAPPTPDYKRLQGSLDAIPDLSIFEYQTLIELARTFDQEPPSVAPAPRAPTGDVGSRPGDRYNEAASGRDVEAILTGAGWSRKCTRRDGTICLTRPGKSTRHGISATIRVDRDVPIFYCFSSNAAPFAENKGYAPFQVYALVDHAGDWKAAAVALADQGYGDSSRALQLVPKSAEDSGSDFVVGEETTGEGKAEEKEKPQKKPPKDIYLAAQRWAKVYGDTWSYDAVMHLWRHWTDTHHQEVPKLSTALDKQAIAVLLGSRMPVQSGGRLDSVIRFASTLCSREFPIPARLVNFANGTLDLVHWSLRPHDPEDGLTYCLPFPFEDADYEMIAEFLAETIPDAYGILALMTHIGLALMGDVRLHYTVLLIGPKRSGKSTCLQLANAACGQSPEANAGASIFNRDSEGLRSRASWNDRRIVTLEELPVEALKNEELVKAMVAHGGVEMRQMYQRAIIENRWRPKLLMATNERPQYSDRTGALSERIVPVSCPNGRSKADRDPLLFERLSTQIGGFAVACLHQAQQVLTKERGVYPMSEGMGDLLEDIEKGGDPLKAFVRDECRSGPNEWAPTDTLYTCYHRYCQEYGYKSVGKEMFSRALCDRYDSITMKPRRVDGRMTRGLEGLYPTNAISVKQAEKQAETA